MTEPIKPYNQTYDVHVQARISQYLTALNQSYGLSIHIDVCPQCQRNYEVRRGEPGIGYMATICQACEGER